MSRRKINDKWLDGAEFMYSSDIHEHAIVARISIAFSAKAYVHNVMLQQC